MPDTHGERLLRTMLERLDSYDIEEHPDQLVRNLRALISSGDFPTSFVERAEEHIYVIDLEGDARQPWMPAQVRNEDQLQRALEQLQELVTQELARP